MRILTGRINSVTGQYPYDPNTNQYNHAVGAYNLDELQKAFGVFFQDSYRLNPNFTLNYGLRWDFTAADRDLTNLYHSASPANIFGPTGINDLFNPGSLTGVANPQLTQNSQPYNNWYVAPQPAIGIAWSPRSPGGDKTVIRAGYSLRQLTSLSSMSGTRLPISASSITRTSAFHQERPVLALLESSLLEACSWAAPCRHTLFPRSPIRRPRRNPTSRLCPAVLGSMESIRI